MRRVAAILLAGGQGSRYGGELPKQFELLNERLILSHALDAFNSCGKVHEIFLVVPPSMPERMAQLIHAEQWHGLRRPLVAGGRRRCDSCFEAIKLLKDYSDDDLVLVHDAARPLVSKSLIERCIAALAAHSAVSAALPVTDTLLRNSEKIKIVRRENLYQLQTPQGFSLGLLREAHAFFYRREEQREEPTDEISLILAYDGSLRVELVAGERRNIKLTYPEDLSLLGLLAAH